MNEENPRTFIVGSISFTEPYEAALRRGGFQTQVFTYTDRMSLKDSRIGSQHSEPQPYSEAVLSAIHNFQPRLIILGLDASSSELIYRIRQAYGDGERPAILVVIPKDAWLEGADACVVSPVDPVDLRQIAHSLLAKHS